MDLHAWYCMSPWPVRLLTTRRMRMVWLLEALKHTHMHTLKPQHSPTLLPSLGGETDKLKRWPNSSFFYTHINKLAHFLPTIFKETLVIRWCKPKELVTNIVTCILLLNFTCRQFSAADFLLFQLHNARKIYLICSMYLCAGVQNAGLYCLVVKQNK